MITNQELEAVDCLTYYAHEIPINDYIERQVANPEDILLRHGLVISHEVASALVSSLMRKGLLERVAVRENDPTFGVFRIIRPRLLR